MRSAILLALSSLLLLLAAAPSAAATPLQDPMVTKALGRIATVETAETTLASGDKQKAAQLLNQLGWATKRLNAVVQQNTSEWKAAKKRHDDVKKKIEAKRDAAPPKPAPKPAPKPGPQPSPTPAPKPAPAKKYDHAALVSLNEAVQREFANIKLLQFKHFLDENRVGGMRKDLAKFRERVAAFPAGHENVKLVTENIDNYEKLFQMGIDKVEADRKTAPAISERLETFFDKYGKDEFPSHVEYPYQEAQLRAWTREVHNRLANKIPTDLAWLDEIAGNVVVGANKLNSVRSHLTVSIQPRMENASFRIKEEVDNRSKDGIRSAEWILETDVNDRNQVTNRILGKGNFESNMRVLEEASHNIAMARVVDEELKRTDAPDRDAQAKTIENARAHLKKLARVALDQVRMPKPASTDADLLKAAKKTLALEKYEIDGWEHLVINSDVKEHARREAYLDSGAVRSTITFYEYKWKQFQVTTAEKVDGEIWLFANTLKFYESGDRTTPTGEWILSNRFELTPILEENLPK